jgi:hypothetical protein
MLNLLEDSSELVEQIKQTLYEYNLNNRIFSEDAVRPPDASAVLFLVGFKPNARKFSSDPGIILNKRSSRVRQPGDLCCPGGGISRLDPYLAKLLFLPFTPLSRWRYWQQWLQRPQEASKLALLFATALREGFEEMRLNPARVKLLGPLPAQRLTTFQRKIYPVVCWISGQKRFVPNREVEALIFIPLKKLLNPANYARYRLKMNNLAGTGKDNMMRELPCFLHEGEGEAERLWGATYHITMLFLEIVFGFIPPALENLPVVHGTLDANYRTGNR